MALTAARTDTQLQSDVLNEIRWDPSIDELDIAVQVKDGIVILTGHVNAFPKKLAARDAAHRVHGVLDVVDELTIKLPRGWERADHELAAAARNALRWDVLVPDEQITSTISSGVVTLQGTVNSWSQRDDAERAIRRLVGLRGVINQIAIAPQKLDPGQIKQAIENALARQAERKARRIGVSVNDGVVTLTGSVRSWSERSAIERLIWCTPGVTRVNDNTELDPSC